MRASGISTECRCLSLCKKVTQRSKATENQEYSSSESGGGPLASLAVRTALAIARAVGGRLTALAGSAALYASEASAYRVSEVSAAPTEARSAEALRTSDSECALRERSERPYRGAKRRGPYARA